MSRHPITPEGYELLNADLQHHKSVLRPQIVRDIEEARAHGDLSENSEYDDAKERQSLCEGRIAYLENMLAGAEIIDVMKLSQSGRVVFGTTVLMENTDTGIEQRWRIVGESETDVENGKISYKSPIGRAMIGRNEGDEVTVPTPAGPRVYEIIEVLYLGPTSPA
jgi:transcription elongation factor GreA